MKVSVVIRCKNEAKSLEILLKNLREEQTFKDFEIVIVDNESEDDTKQVAKRYKVDKVVDISDKEFTHPHSTNLGVENATGDLVVILNGHVLPMTSTWLEDGLKHFDDANVAGVSGHYTDGKPLEDNRKEILSDKDKNNTYHWHLTTTNSIIRKRNWEMYKFDETLPDCEDYDWSEEMSARGFDIIKDPKFSVYHYHKIGQETFDHWAKMRALIESRQRPYKQ